MSAGFSRRDEWQPLELGMIENCRVKTRAGFGYPITIDHLKMTALFFYLPIGSARFGNRSVSTNATIPADSN
jgi:hypothetical protein